MYILNFEERVICKLDVSSYKNEQEALEVAIGIACSNDQVFTVTSDDQVVLWEKIASDSQFITIKGFDEEEIFAMDLSCYESTKIALDIAIKIAKSDDDAYIVIDENKKILWEKTAPAIDELA